jgi:membrane-associated protease RseP (regulator of RpoE activity)
MLPSVARAQSEALLDNPAPNPNQATHEQASKNGDWASKVQSLNGANDVQLKALLTWDDGKSESPRLAELLFDAGDQGSGLKLAPVDEATRVHLKLPAAQGLIATSVLPQGAAARAGIAQNDILLILGDAPLAKPEDLETTLKAAGEKPLELIVLHQGSRKTIQIQPRIKITFEPAAPAPPSFWIGVSVSPIDPSLRAHLRIPPNGGLIVTDVIAQGPASKAGIKVNDILLSMGKRPLRDQSALVDIVQKNGDSKADIEILREGSHQTTSVTPERRNTGLTSGRAQLSNNFHVLHPGFVVQAHSLPTVLPYEPSRDMFWHQYPIYQNNPQPIQASPDHLGKRLENMSAEIKELRKAVEDLEKALKDRK